MKENHKLIAIVGETASGKTSLGVNIAKKYRGEIICADSRTIYKGMNIGTAKPTDQEMENIPHFGLDLAKPNERYTAAQFKDYATGVIEDIQSRRRLPIIVGGTGLYVDGVLFGYSFGGNNSSVNRSELDNKTVAELASIAKNNNYKIDQQTLKNKRHLIRMIERGGQTENNKNLVYDTLLLGYKTNRNVLRKRIERRVEVMFRKGLRKEYNDLVVKYGSNSEALTGIGYREFTNQDVMEASTSEVKRLIVKNTIKLAKRQRTWFKKNPYINWVEDELQALQLVDEFLS